MKYSIVIVVIAGQEGFLPQTLRPNLDACRDKDAEVLLVNYGASDDVGQLVQRVARPELETGALVYVKVKDPPPTNLSHAANVGLRVAAGEFIGTVEPDGFIDVDFFDVLQFDTVTRECPLVGFFPNVRVVAHRDVVAGVGGLDEEMRGWGYQLNDFFERARLHVGPGRESRRPLAIERRLDVDQAWRNADFTDAPGEDIDETNRLNATRSVEHVRAKQYAVNPEGYGRATVYLNFNDQETVLE